MTDKPIANFIKYNNTIPIVISFVLLGAGGAFAATNPDVQQAVVSTTQTVRSVDNTYIANVDLDAFPVAIEVKQVTEDADSFYVVYELHTIDIVDFVWQNIAKPKTLIVAKAQLHSGDLGLYVQKQLSEVRASEHERLVQTQKIEKANGVTQKAVATVYSGLVGKFLDPKEEVFPGYTPVVVEPIPLPNPDVPANSIPSATFDANAAIILPPVTMVDVSPPPTDTPPSTLPPSSMPPTTPPTDVPSPTDEPLPPDTTPPPETSSSSPTVDTPPTETPPPAGTAAGSTSGM